MEREGRETSKERRKNNNKNKKTKMCYIKLSYMKVHCSKIDGDALF
jgi:hypothetical protein